MEDNQKMITEVLSVSSIVERVANDIFHFIKQNHNINKVRDVSFIGSADITLKTHDFDNEEDVNDFNEECEYERYEEAYIDKSQKIHGIKFHMECATLNGNIVNDKLLDVLYHEVEHAYQDYCKLVRGVDVSKTPRYKLYKFAIEHMNNTNYCLFVFCYIVYMSDWNEQDSFVNQLYSMLNQNNKVINKYNLNTYYHESDAYSHLKRLLKFQKELPKWDENDIRYSDMKFILNMNNINFDKNQIIELLNKTIGRFSTKIGKILAKIMLEKNITEHVAYYRKPIPKSVLKRLNL